MKPDRYEVTRDATGKATATPVFDQPYGLMLSDGSVVAVPDTENSRMSTETKSPPWLQGPLEPIKVSSILSEFYDGIPTAGGGNAGQVGKLFPSMITLDGQVLRGMDPPSNLLSSYSPAKVRELLATADKLSIAGSLVDGLPGAYHYMGDMHYDPTLEKINTSTPNALTPVDPQVAAIREMADQKNMEDAMRRLDLDKISASHRTATGVHNIFVSPEDLEYIKENNMVANERPPSEVAQERAKYYSDYTKMKAPKLPGIFGPLTTIGTAAAAALYPQDAQAMSESFNSFEDMDAQATTPVPEDVANLLKDFNEGWSQIPQTKGERFLSSIKEAIPETLNMVPGEILGDNVMKTLTTPRPGSLPPNPLLSPTARFLGGIGTAMATAPEVGDFMTGQGDYDPNKHGMQIGPIDIGRLPYHFNRTFFGHHNPVGEMLNHFDYDSPRPF